MLIKHPILVSYNEYRGVTLVQVCVVRSVHGIRDLATLNARSSGYTLPARVLCAPKLFRWYLLQLPGLDFLLYKSTSYDFN